MVVAALAVLVWLVFLFGATVVEWLPAFAVMFYGGLALIVAIPAWAIISASRDSHH